MTETQLTNLATPYYGSIAREGHGYENIYIFASTSLKTGKVEKTWVEAWNGRTAGDLSNWLAEKNVEGIFADGFSLALEKELNKANICSHWSTSSDINEIAEQHWKDFHAA